MRMGGEGMGAFKRVHLSDKISPCPVPRPESGSAMQRLKWNSHPSFQADRREGMTMCVLTHEMRFARELAQRVIFMDEGQIVEVSTPDQFFDNPQTNRANQFISKILTH